MHAQRVLTAMMGRRHHDHDAQVTMREQCWHEALLYSVTCISLLQSVIQQTCTHNVVTVDTTICSTIDSNCTSSGCMRACMQYAVLTCSGCISYLCASLMTILGSTPVTPIQRTCNSSNTYTHSESQDIELTA
jgi:hypothetical protein